MTVSPPGRSLEQKTAFLGDLRADGPYAGGDI